MERVRTSSGHTVVGGKFLLGGKEVLTKTGKIIGNYRDLTQPLALKKFQERQLKLAARRKAQQEAAEAQSTGSINPTDEPGAEPSI